jgi:putative phosphoesterase
MRIAFVSDMHGNDVGFEAVVRELAHEQFDEIVCLGDVAQGGPQPVEVIDRLRRLGWRCVFGNSDEFLLTLAFGNEEVTERILAVGEWSREQLGEEGLGFVRSFEPTVEFDVDGRRLVCCHATPTSNEEVILPNTPREDVVRELGDADIVAGGHVHLQWHRRIGDRLWFCAGSAGLVYQTNEPTFEPPFEPWAEYAVLTAADGALRLEFRRVQLDPAAVIAAIRESGMPDADFYASQWKAT